MNDAIEQVSQSYKAVRAMSVEQRERIICAIRELTRKEAQAMAELGVLETGMGKVEHKRLKHLLVADKTPGTEDLVSHAKTGDHGLTLVEMAPYGVIGSITPSTNPSETVICNSIGMVAAGNSVVFNPTRTPSPPPITRWIWSTARQSSPAGGYSGGVHGQTHIRVGGGYAVHPDIKLLVCTGGPGVVKAVLASGKRPSAPAPAILR